MKVLVIPTWYPSGADKLMGIYHKEFTEGLNKKGIEANILFIDRERLKSPFKYLFMKKKEVIKETNYKTYLYRMLNYSPISFELQMKMYTKKMLKAFKDYLKTNEMPDVIHAHVTVPAGYAACVLGKKYNIPVVVTEHCGDLERFYTKEPWIKYGKYVLEHSLYTTVSDYMKDIVLKYKDECYTLPNTVNVSIFNNNVKRKVKDEFKLVSACALREGKKLEVAFEALKILKDKGINIHLDIIGDGFLESYYKKQSKEIGVSDIVTFMGRKTKKEMAEIFKNEHALLISSELESFAIPGIEGLASGMPVISTDCFGPRMFVTKETGELCKVNDANDLAKKIEKVYEKYESYDPKVLKQTADKFSEETVTDLAKDLYQKAIEK